MISEAMRKADHQHCEAIIAKYSSSFRLAFAQLPKRKRQAIYAVYALCRELDDSIDNYQDEARLNQFSAWFEALIAGEEVVQPIFISLAQAYQEFKLPTEPVRALIRGIRSDLNFQQPTTDNELDMYCYQVAGTVGELILPILATQHAAELGPQAVALGKAMQLTNILRDVGEDFQAKRVYLSQATLATFQVTLATEMQQPAQPTANYLALWEFYAKKAEAYYASGLAQLHLYDEDSRKLVEAAAHIYGAILPEVRRQGYRLDKRAVVPKTTKLRMLRAK